MSGDASMVEGPLKGYHHETHVFRLLGGADTYGSWKCRGPRSNLLWFDLRSFVSEEQLLGALKGRITRIPEIIQLGSLRTQRFIEGETLGARHRSGTAIPESILRQIVTVFLQMARVRPEELSAGRICGSVDPPADGDTNGFLERLVHFTEERVFRCNAPQYEELFWSLGLHGGSFKNLRNQVAGLAHRPFCLLHADLHRENFILDPRDQLWVIDWELAMVGDPLYDLATHLHLMRYPARQERAMVNRWRTALEEVRPGGSHGWAEDLPKLLDYKRAQSVFTDVIRVSHSLHTPPERVAERAFRAGEKLHEVLTAAACPLGLDTVPSAREISSSLAGWYSERESVPGPRSDNS